LSGFLVADEVGHLAEPKPKKISGLVEETADIPQTARLAWASARRPGETTSTSGQTEQNLCDKPETVRDRIGDVFDLHEHGFEKLNSFFTLIQNHKRAARWGAILLARRRGS
jgi:hypothetical protein